MTSNEQIYTLQPSAALKGLAGLIASLLLLHLASFPLRFADPGPVHYLDWILDMDRESNAPTLYSTLQLLLASVLSTAVWRGRRDAGGPKFIWLTLAVVMLFLALDEYFQLHETFNTAEYALVSGTGYFFEAVWVVPYLLGALAFALVTVPFLAAEARNTQWLLYLSGAIYVGGAAGIEMISGKYCELAYAADPDFEMRMDLGYRLITGVEESMEMLGVAGVIYTLLTLIQQNLGGLTVQVPAASATSLSQPRTESPNSTP